MSTETKRTLVIASVERIRNSANGNPRHLVRFADGVTVAKTGPDSTIGGAIENSEYQGVNVEVTFRDGDIVGVEIL